MNVLQLPRRRQADDFARLLDGGRVPASADPELADLTHLARALVPAQHAPREDFRAALRARLVAEAEARPAVPAPAPVPEAERAATPRLRQAVATAAVVAVVTGAGVAAASTRALPGDTLYGLKRQIENAQLALARNDLDRGREHLEQAEERLSEAERLAASVDAGRPGIRQAIGGALTEMETATAAGAADLTASYRDTGDPEPIELLDRFLAAQQVRLTDLYAVLDPSLRARLAAHLDELSRLALQARGVLGSGAASVAASATDRPTAGGQPRSGAVDGRDARSRTSRSTGGPAGAEGVAGVGAGTGTEAVADGLTSGLPGGGPAPGSGPGGQAGPVTSSPTRVPSVTPPPADLSTSAPSPPSITVTTPSVPVPTTPTSLPTVQVTSPPTLP